MKKGKPKWSAPFSYCLGEVYSAPQMFQSSASFVRDLSPSTVFSLSSLTFRLSAIIVAARASSICIAGIKYVFFIIFEI